MEKVKPNIQHVYADLDSIFDTRLTYLYQLSPDYAETALKNGYFERKNDDFSLMVPGIDMTLYREHYKNRCVEEITGTTITNVPRALLSITNALQNKAPDSPMIERICLTINTYPYVFSDKGKERLIEYITEYVSLSTEIQLVHYPLSVLTPYEIRENYSLVILYHFHEWIRLQQENLVKLPIPRITIMAPELFENSVPMDRDVMVPELESVVDPFTTFRFLVKETMDLIFEDVRLFSAYVHA
jgi:hypothetical protein